MLFNSFTFLAFFAIIAIAYYLLPHRFRWVLLVIASIYFYATFNVTYTLLLIGVMLVTYVLGLGIARAADPRTKKFLLIVGIIGALSPLFVYKYFDFFAESIDDLILGIYPAPQPTQFAPRLWPAVTRRLVVLYVFVRKLSCRRLLGETNRRAAPRSFRVVCFVLSQAPRRTDRACHTLFAAGLNNPFSSTVKMYLSVYS